MKALIQRLSIASKLTAINLAAIVVLAVSIGAIAVHLARTEMEAKPSIVWTSTWLTRGS